MTILGGEDKMQTKNKDKKEIWFDKEKLNNIQDKLTKDSWKPFYSATRLEALTYCLEKYVTSDWIKTTDDLKNFCFYFSDILKTHLYDEKENRWLENPFDDGKFCNAMFNLLNKDKSHLSRNCVLLLENFCLPDIHTRNQNTALFYSITINVMNLFFTNKWDHMPKPSDQFMSFLRNNIRMCDIENYCTKFINSKLQAGLKPEELKSRKWIVVQENNNDIQTQNNFVISSLSLFLDKNFKYPFECEKNELDFIKSAMNIYENMYQKFMDLPHSKKKDAIYDFFNLFSSNFIKHIICSYREDKTASIKYKHGIYLFYRFCLILQNDEEHLNLVLENLFKIIDIRQDFVLPYKNAYGTWNLIKCCGSIATNFIANKLSSEKSVSDLMNGQILNYEELLPDELIDKMKKYNDKSKSELQFDIKQEIFLIKNGIFYCDENKFLENIESICKIFGLISDKDGKAKKIDDIHLKDFFKVLAKSKFNLFKYVCKLESCYGDVAIRGISFLISEFEKFIKYHSLQGETNKLFLSNSNNNTFTKNPLFPNPYVHFLYNLMITKFIKAQTKSDELAEIVSILLRRFGSIYNLIKQVKNILAEKNYGYKLKGLWNFVLDCVLYVDKESNKSILSLLIKLVNDNLKKYLEKNDLEQGEIALSLVKSALLLFNVAKAFDYDTSIFFGGQEQKHKNDISKRTFDLLNKIIEDKNFKLFFELDKTLSVDLTSIKNCFKQITNLKFEVLLYLNDEIFNPNVKQLEEFSPLLEKCADICNEDDKTTIFDLIQQTEEFAQKKVSKMERINKIKNGAKKIKNYAHEVKEHNLEDKNLFLDNIQTENERESRKANDLLKNLLKQAKKVVGSINVGERGEYLLHSDLLNQYFNSLYEIFCMVYDPKQHSNLKSEYKNTYREIIFDSYNSTIVTKISELTVSAITGLNKKNIFEKTDELENIDIEIIGSIISLILPHCNDQAVFFKNEKGENIISNVVGVLKQLQENLIDYKKKLRRFNTDQLLNELKNHKGQEISFANQLIKKAYRKQERLLNNLEIKSGQFDAELYKKKKKAMTQLTDLNIYTIKLIASLCILKSSDNYVANVADTVNHFCKKLHDFLDTLYVSEDEKNPNKEYKSICVEIISEQKHSEMVREISKFTIDAIRFLNEKDIFEKVDCAKRDTDQNIDIKTVDSIISLLSNRTQKDIIFFKDENDQNITSDIVGELKLLKTNFTDYIYNQENKKIVNWIDALRFYAFIASPIGATYSENKKASNNINKCLDCLYKVFCILYDTEKVDSLKPEYKEIYKRIICDSKNSELVLKMSQQTHQLINKLNKQEVFDSIDNPKEIKIETIKSIISLFSNNHNEKTVLFKNKDGTNITSNIIDGLKSFKDKLLQYVNEKSNLQKSNENQMVNEIIVNEIKEKKEEHQNPENILETTSSEEINSNEKDELRNIYDNKNNDANNLQDNHDTIENLKKNKKINRENNVVDENENVSSTENDNKIKVHDENNTKKDNNEKQIGEKEQNLQDETDVKANDTLQLIKNAFDINNEETYHKTTNRRYSFSISQNTIKTALDNENASVKKRDKNDNKDKFDILTMQNEIDSSDINMTSNQNIKLSNDINLNNKVDDVKKNEIESNDYNPTTIDRKERKSQKVVIPQCYTNVESQKNMINNTNDKNDKSDNKKIEENNKISEIDNDQIQMNEDNYNQIKTEILSNSQEKNNISGETTNVDLKTSNSCETAEKKKVVNEESNAKNETQEKNDTIKNVFTTIKNLFADNHKRQSFTTERKYSSSTCLKKIISIDEKTDYPEKQKTKSNVKTKTSTDNSDKEKTNVNSKTDSLQGADYSKNNLHNLKSDIEIKCHHNSKSLCLFLKRLFIFI